MGYLELRKEGRLPPRGGMLSRRTGPERPHRLSASAGSKSWRSPCSWSVRTSPWPPPAPSPAPAGRRLGSPCLRAGRCGGCERLREHKIEPEQTGMPLPPLPAAALAHPSPTAPPQPSRALRGASPRRLHICHTLSLAPFVARRMQGGWRAAFANQSAGPPRWRRVRFLPRAAELGEPWTTRSGALVGARGPLTEDQPTEGCAEEPKPPELPPEPCEPRTDLSGCPSATCTHQAGV